MTPIPLGFGFGLTTVRALDTEAMVACLADEEISRWTLRIPFPYSKKDAEEFLGIIEQTTKEAGRPVHFAVRGDDDGRLAGIVGIDFWRPGHTETELGYWIGKKYWNRGLATRAVTTVTALAFESYGVTRLTAHVFEGNDASVRVLDKCGYRFEKSLPGHHRKAGVKVDSRLFAKQKL